MQGLRRLGVIAALTALLAAGCGSEPTLNGQASDMDICESQVGAVDEYWGWENQNFVVSVAERDAVANGRTFECGYVGDGRLGGELIIVVQPESARDVASTRRTWDVDGATVFIDQRNNRNLELWTTVGEWKAAMRLVSSPGIPPWPREPATDEQMDVASRILIDVAHTVIG